MSSSDIICLQEFWFDQAYEAIFRAALGDDYNFHTLQRTGSKDDGVAVLLRRGKWEVRSSSGLSLSPVGDRVALVMHLRTVQSKSENSLGGVSKHAGTPAGAGGDGTRGGAAQHGGEDVILVNTHLAFPHHAHDRVNQVWQIRTVTEAVECLVRDAGLPTMTPRVVVGDLNVEDSDPVCRHLSTNGFRSAFASLHREQRVVTHLNHRGEEVRHLCYSDDFAVVLVVVSVGDMPLTLYVVLCCMLLLWWWWWCLLLVFLVGVVVDGGGGCVVIFVKNVVIVVIVVQQRCAL